MSAVTEKRPRRRNVPELVGTMEIARALGVKRNRVSMWEMRWESTGFPAPLAELAAGPVYDMAEIRAWWRDRNATVHP